MSRLWKKSKERLSSPEQIDDCIRVTTPAVWIALIALIVLLVGILIWCIFGTITVHDVAGNEQEIHPIIYVTN